MVEKLLCVSGPLVTEAVKAAKDLDNTQDISSIDTLVRHSHHQKQGSLIDSFPQKAVALRLLVWRVGRV